MQSQGGVVVLEEATVLLEGFLGKGKELTDGLLSICPAGAPRQGPPSAGHSVYKSLDAALWQS